MYLNALVKNWGRILKDEDYNDYRGEEYIPNVSKICQLDKVNKEVYLELARRKCEIPTDRWQSWLKELKVALAKAIEALPEKEKLFLPGMPLQLLPCWCWPRLFLSFSFQG